MTFTSFPLEIAAEKLGVTRRQLMEWLRRHPRDAAGRAFYGRMGRVKLFTEDDLARILAALREDRPCSSSIRRGRGASGAPTSDAVWTSLAELTGDKSLLEFSKRSQATGASGALTSDAVLIRAAELTGDRSLLPSSMRSQARSNEKSGPRLKGRS
jgi:hypothetical protein